MAETTKKENATTKTTQAAERSQAKRKRFSLSQALRDRNYEWYFPGLQQGETVALVVRKHWWFLVQPALPFVGSIVLLLIVLWASTILPGDSLLWLAVDVIAIALIIGTGILFAYKDLVAWWYNSYIITNKRIIHASGLLQPTRKDVSMDKVQQVGIDLTTILGVFLQYGTVHLYLAGDDFKMLDVQNPKHVRDVITEISEAIKAKKTKEPDPPTPQDSTMATVLKDLAQGKPVPKLENADEHLPIPHDAERVFGPRRTFGILRLPCGVRYTSGEYTVTYIQRSRYVLWRNLSLPTILLLMILTLAVAIPSMSTTENALWALQYWWIIMGLIVLVLSGWMALLYLDYVDDVYILSNKRIIQIDRNYFNLARIGRTMTLESRIEIDYKNIRDSKVQVPNILQRVLNLGNVYVETPGKNPDIIFRTVGHPFEVLDKINAIKGHKEKEDKIKKENEEKKNLYRWFSNVVVKLEETTKGRGAPDLRNKDLVAALSHAKELGLDVTVWGEAVPTTNVPPGSVIYQNPPPGTLMETGSTIEVVLSKKPSLVD